MPYIGRTKGNNIRTQRFIADGVRKIFTTEFIPLSDNQMSVYIDGVYLNDQDFVFKHPNKVLLSDAPAHQVFVLLGPMSEGSSDGLPDVLCAIQVCYEGEINQ